MKEKLPLQNVEKRPLVFLYAFIYLPWFLTLEHCVKQYYLIECRLDYIIPFCEYFIIPYLFWFLFVAMSFIWFLLFEDDKLFYRFAGVMFGGMTIALIIYTVFPNGIQLRPNLDASKNICTWLTSLIYRADTATNVFPSLHVYTSAVIGMFFMRSSLHDRKPYICHGICTVSLLIISSTVFLKQHSVLDLAAGFFMAWALCHAVFVEEEEKQAQNSHQSTGRRRRPVLR